MVRARRTRHAIGAVASPHWLASAAGKDVLEQGGNALDACIAMNAMLAVVYPHMCGPGGDLFLLYYDARTAGMHSLNGSGRAPKLASRSEFLRRGLVTVPLRGPLSVTVPGAVHAWKTAIERFGSWELGRTLEPAIKAATNGVEVTARLAGWVSSNSADLFADPTLRAWFFDVGGEPIQAGAQLVRPELAETLRRIGTIGADDFYAGALAHEIDRAMHDADGLLRYEDLAEHRSDWTAPISTNVGALDFYTTPPNSQGVVALEMLNLLKLWDIETLSPGTAEHIHHIVRAKVVAFADRRRYLGDPAFSDVPVSRLLSEEHVREAAGISGIRDRSAVLEGDTVYVCAVDESRNVCSLIQSIYYAFGSAFVVGDTGVLLHNRGHYFSLDESSINALEPGKRPAHTLMASIGMREAQPWLVLGTMGADGQPQTVTQVLLRLLAGEHPQEAVSAPRVLSGRFLLEDSDDRLLVESSHGLDIVRRLEALGHDVEIVPELDERMGHAHAIVIKPDGGLEAGSDVRSDGEALVF